MTIANSREFAVGLPIKVARMEIEWDRRMDKSKSVAVLGLGAMGTALARSFLAAGLSVVVWNRSAEKSAALAAEGAIAAETASQAVSAAELSVILCVGSFGGK